MILVVFHGGKKGIRVTVGKEVGKEIFPPRERVKEGNRAGILK